MGLFLKYGEAVLKIFTVFKACVHFFYQFFTISQNDSPLKTMKNECFLFHLKGSFRSQDISLSFFSFLSMLSRFERTNGSGIIYDVIN